VDGKVEVGCRSSLIGIITQYGLDGQGIGVRFLAGAIDVSVLQSVQTGSGADPALYELSIGSCFCGIKRSGREADQSPLSVTDVKNEWSYTSTTTFISYLPTWYCALWLALGSPGFMGFEELCRSVQWNCVRAPNIPSFWKSCKRDISDSACEHFEFVSVGESISGSRTAVSRPRTESDKSKTCV
jgi:hypothetical protein